MTTLQANLLYIVELAILLAVPYFIARLITKKVLKEKSKGFRIAGFIIIFGVSLAITFCALLVGDLMVFGR